MFITVEGIEGSGKTTQLTRLRDYLTARGREVVVTREPGGSRLGRELRRILLAVDSDDLTREAELFLYLADRAQHTATVIRPALARGEAVLSDRFADSTVVYQGYGRGLDPGLLRQLNEVATCGLLPDLTLLLDLPPELGLNRALRRNAAAGTMAAEGRFEALELEFHRRVRQGYLAWAAVHKERFAVVDASRGEDEVWADVLAAVEARL